MNSITEILEQLERPVDVKKLIAKLAFDLDNFEEANLEQPRLYLEAGRYLTWAVLEKAKTELRLETKTADVGLALREKKDGTKRTEKAIADLTLADAEVNQLGKKFAFAKAADTWAKMLVAAYEQRLQVLSNITKIRTAEVSSSLRAVKEKAALDIVRRAAEKVRERYPQ